MHVLGLPVEVEVEVAMPALPILACCRSLNRPGSYWSVQYRKHDLAMLLASESGKGLGREHGDVLSPHVV